MLEPKPETIAYIATPKRTHAQSQVQERVTKQAVNVMDLYAKRARVERDPCKPDGPEMIEFCRGFEHQPTKDQV